ncbi:MAG: hypothetical protein AB1403_06125 [Candidatus Riflebacteria bacterium]
MGIKRALFAVLFFSLAFSLAAHAADDLVIHGLISQGYLKSSDNHYLALSEDGSTEFNEFIINFQKQMDDRLRLGLQLISRDLGKEGNNEVKVDWAYGDYRLNENFGLRFGRVKVPFGFYNQYRDIDMLRTPVLLPGTIYMEDYRTFLTAFTGGSIYGTIPFERSSFDLEFAFGEADIDADAGVVKDTFILLNNAFEGGLTSALPAALQAAGVKYAHSGDPTRETSSKPSYSAKLIWNTAIEGLRIGGTRTNVDTRMKETLVFQPLIVPMPALTTITPGFSTVVDLKYRFLVDIGSLEYTKNKFTFSAEYMAAHGKQEFTFTSTAVAPLRKAEAARTAIGSYYQLVYRHNDKNEWSIYRGELFSDKNNKIPTEFHKDTCLSYRHNITRDWSVKLEYHWVDGTGQIQQNLNMGKTLDRKWNLLAFKTTYNF